MAGTDEVMSPEQMASMDALSLARSIADGQKHGARLRLAQDAVACLLQRQSLDWSNNPELLVKRAFEIADAFLAEADRRAHAKTT